MLLKSFESLKPSDSHNMSIHRKYDDSYQGEPHTSANDARGVHKDNPTIADGPGFDTVKCAVDTSNGNKVSFDLVRSSEANSNEERRFRFEVSPTILVGSPSISGGHQMEGNRMKEISAGPHQVYDLKIRDGGDKVNPSTQLSEGMIFTKGTPARRTRLDPNKASGQESAKKVKTNKNVKGIGAVQQPFTDMQQVQLGAQILVYGSLMQGTTPDGASMISAFGPSDEARHEWEPTWHACLERLQGTKTSLQASKRGPLPPHQPLSPLQHKQDSRLPNFAGHNLSLLSQQNYSVFHIIDAMKLTPVKESSPLLNSSRKRNRGDPTVENDDPDIEAKLASASLAISAAASAAEVAALAAKIASNAALQAKQMADEAFSQRENGRSTQNDSITLPGAMSSNIIAAREASRRRVQAASAALKHAENLNDIVKAAELTVEAVFQTRKVLTLGDHDFISDNVSRDPSTSKTAEQVTCSSAKQPMEMHT